MSIYTCSKEVHEASNSVLPLFSWVEEDSLSSHMFTYWVLIDKFLIDYLEFIGSMRKDNLNFLPKFWYLWWTGFSFSNITIMLDGHLCTFKICWVYPSHFLNSIKNFEEEILGSRFQVGSFHQFIITKLMNKARRTLSLEAQQESNSSLLSLWTNTQPFSQTGQFS